MRMSIFFIFYVMTSDDDGSDSESFHMSVWSQQRRQKMVIAFDVSESEPEVSPFHSRKEQTVYYSFAGIIIIPPKVALFFSTLTWMPLYIFTIPLFSIKCSQNKRNKVPVVFFSVFLPDNRFVVVLFQIFFSMQTVLESKSRKQAYPKETYRPKFRGGPNSQLSNGHVPSGVQREDESPHLRQVRTMFVSLRWSMVIIMRGTSRINAHILWLEDVLHYQLQPLK